MRRAAVPLACLSAAATAQQPSHTCGDPSDGAVLGGVDMVGTYNNPTAKPQMGTSAFVDSSLGGYQFYFANQANLDAFQANATKYVPRYGGY